MSMAQFGQFMDSAPDVIRMFFNARSGSAPLIPCAHFVHGTSKASHAVEKTQHPGAAAARRQSAHRGAVEAGAAEISRDVPQGSAAALRNRTRSAVGLHGVP